VASGREQEVAEGLRAAVVANRRRRCMISS
jgi:hypothetical protein